MPTILSVGLLTTLVVSTASSASVNRGLLAFFSHRLQSVRIPSAPFPKEVLDGRLSTLPCFLRGRRGRLTALPLVVQACREHVDKVC